MRGGNHAAIAEQGARVRCVHNYITALNVSLLEVPQWKCPRSLRADAAMSLTHVVLLALNS